MEREFSDALKRMRNIFHKILSHFKTGLMMFMFGDNNKKAVEEEI